MRLIGYVRLRTAGHGDRTDVRLVEESQVLESWAGAEGYRLVGISHDIIDRSRQEPLGLYHAIASIERRVATGLLVYRLNRLGYWRFCQEAVLAHIWKREGEVFTCRDGQVTHIRSGDLVRRAMRDALNSFVHLERDIARVRNDMGRKLRVERGYHSGGPPAYGYKVVGQILVQEPEEQDTLRRIMELHAEGISLREVARTLTVEGRRPKRSENWHPETLRRIIRRFARSDDMIAAHHRDRPQ